MPVVGSSKLPQPVLFTAGLLAIALVCVKHRMFGYIKPAPEPSDGSTSEDETARIAEEWREHLEAFCGNAWAGEDVVELGPGDSLHTGELILNEAASYCALDAFCLAKPNDERITYIVDPQFRIDEIVGQRRFTRLVSCAAFEHFDDPADTIARLTRIAAPGAVACFRIDLATHTGILRKRDPNNIYRFPDWVYWAFPFPGKPNRFRPGDYARLLEANGWIDIRLVAVQTADEHYVERARLARKFSTPEARMDVLSLVVLARMPGEP